MELEKILASLKKQGGFPVVKEPASFMDPKYKIIVLYLDATHKRLYQIMVFDTILNKIVMTCN